MDMFMIMAPISGPFWDIFHYFYTIFLSIDIALIFVNYTGAMIPKQRFPEGLAVISREPAPEGGAGATDPREEATIRSHD